MKAEVEALLALVARRVVAGGRHIRLAAEDRLDALLAAFIVERLQREEIPVVRDGQRRHSHGLRLGDERLDLALSVKKRICCVKMEMYEVGHGEYYNKKCAIISAR